MEYEGMSRLGWVFDFSIFSKFYLQKTNQVSTKVIKISLSSKPIPRRVYRNNKNVPNKDPLDISNICSFVNPDGQRERD